ncbi:MAG: acyl-CoA dehydrogenase family protein [Deltaproteobacteria bacterium]|nr:acyl-CoA dehydrogenase family protein [Deltaproteobacteria bacterium]
MDFNLTEEQLMFADSVEKFARKEIAPGVEEREEVSGFSRDVWKKMSEFGLNGLCIPVEYGGGGADPITTIIGTQAFARGSGDVFLVVAWLSHLLLAAMPIVDLGTEEQKKKYLPKMASGEWIGAYALTEPEAGTDATGLRTTARKEGDHYILNGSKTFISNAPIADVFVVFASIDLSLRAGGITIFVVERNTPGLTTGKPLRKYDGHSSPTGEIFFEDCAVPVENLLGKEGEGFFAMISSLGWERMAFGACVGAMEWELEQCIAYARERKQFGKPIAKFQLVQAMLAEMKIDLEAARYLVYNLAWKKHMKTDTALDAAITKTFVTEAAHRNSQKAVQIFGGNGCMREYPVGHNFWASKMGVIGGGTSQIQRVIIGRMLAGV